MKLFSRASKWTVMVVTIGIMICGGIVLKYTSRKTIGQPITASYGVSDIAFRESMAHLLGPSLLPGNQVEELLNGAQIFPAMLRDIASARHTITLETYIWESGQVSDQLIQALVERATNGVKVNMVVDGMGTLKFNKEDRNKLKAAGVKLVKFGRSRWYKVKLSVDHRTHRKLLVIDGKVGFIGGACVADAWMGNGDTLESWRDTHFRIEGPAVKQMQGIFTENWLLTTGEVLHGPDYFPVLEPKGNSLVQCFKSGPKDGEEHARLAHLYAIAGARRNIRLAHAYFLPDDLTVQMLLQARERGVEVEVIVPKKNDSQIGRAAARSRWGKLLDAGVKIYQFEPALFHCKVMIVDDSWVTAGSINFDARSFRINDEADFNVYDPRFATAQVETFKKDKARSQPLTVRQFHERAWWTKTGDSLAGFLRSEL